MNTHIISKPTAVGAGGSGILGFARRAALLLGLGLAAPPLLAADNEAIIAQARAEAKEGTFSIMISSPKGEAERKAVMDAFQERFDIKLQWDWLPLNSGVSAPRIVEAAKGKAPLPAVIGGYPYVLYENMIVGNGLDVTVDWVGEFGEMFPAIGQAAVDGVLPAYHGRLLRQWDVKYVMVYNTRLVKPEDVPTSYEELAEPKWRGRFSMTNNTASPPLSMLALEWGLDKTVDLTRKLVANQPRYKAGPPAEVGAVASGEAAVALGGYTALAESQKAIGAPVDWVALDNMPVTPLMDFLLKGAPQPTLARLFLAWLVTEGLEIQEEVEYLSFYSNENSPTTRRIKEMRPDVNVVEVRSDEDLEASTAAWLAVLDIISGSGK